MRTCAPADSQLDLSTLIFSPVEAVRRMIERTFDYQELHPDFIRLVSIENIHHGKHLAKIEGAAGTRTRGDRNTLRDVLTRGQEIRDSPD